MRNNFSTSLESLLYAAILLQQGYCDLIHLDSVLQRRSGRIAVNTKCYATDGLSVTGDGGGGSGSCINSMSLEGEGGGPSLSEKCKPSEK